jgi:hypothetical protein
MTSGWSITQGSTTVFLPTAPRVIADANPVKIDELGVEGAGSVLVSRFNQARKLKLQGSIYVSGSSNSTLESTYLSPLRVMARQIVTITDPDSQFNGNWVMGEPDFQREAEGASVRYTYTLEFLQANTAIVLGSGPTNSDDNLEGNYTTWTFKWTKNIGTITSNASKSLYAPYVSNNGSVIFQTATGNNGVVFITSSGTATYDGNKHDSAYNVYPGIKTESIFGSYYVCFGKNATAYKHTFYVFKNLAALFNRDVTSDDSQLNTNNGIAMIAISSNGKYICIISNDSSGYWNYVSLYEGSL